MGRPPRALIPRFAAIACLAASLPACSLVQRTTAPVSGQPSEAPPASSAAVPMPSATTALLTQSRTARDAGDFAAAAAAIERALRIEPNNARLWLEYAQLRLVEGDLDQAETLARKAATLAGEDRAVREAADRLLAETEGAR